MVLLQSKGNPLLKMREGHGEGRDRLKLHRARQFNREALDADLILTMTQSHKDYILNRFPNTKGRVFVLGSL